MKNTNIKKLSCSIIKSNFTKIFGKNMRIESNKHKQTWDIQKLST
jgi:hypothetical protein